MTNVQQIYDMAIHLMDEQNESTGATQTVDTDEYRYRTISILNTIIPVLYSYTSAYDPSQGRILPDMLTASNYKMPDFTQEVPLDDTLSLSLLPLYLAAQLLSGENEELAAWFMNLYHSTFKEVSDKSAPASFQPISTPYGLF